MEIVEKRSNYPHILKYTGVFAGVQGVVVLVTVLRNMIVARLLGPQGMGLMSLFNSTIKLFSDSTSLGIPTSGVREVSEIYEQQNKQELVRVVMIIRAWSLFAGLIGMAACVLLSPYLDSWTFDWGNHTLHFMLLSPVVFLVAIAGGETAILKGTRQLKKLAKVSVYHVLLGFLISVPVFYVWGEAGIVPSLVIMALLQLLLTIVFSYRLYPLRLGASGGFSLIREGFGMVKLGVAFMLTGIIASGAEFVIRAYLSYNGSLDMVGLYNAGFMVTITYAGMVFTALETDYYPRLSAIRGTGYWLNTTVNRQIEVCLLTVSPLLVFFIIAMPMLLPLLYSGKFMPVVPMAQVTLLAMYVRAIKLPIAYLPLAKGDSWTYLALEGIYYVVFPVLVILFYNRWGLLGTGIAITTTAVLDFIMLTVVMRLKYGYVLSAAVVRYAFIQLPIGIVAYMLTFVEHRVIYWIGGAMLCVASLTISVVALKMKSEE
ncbi:MAG: oligosaccharide flippase family protein [Prevotella sp.]|nr:oligosaccharide flippase family protein [Prevotella sp.]